MARSIKLGHCVCDPRKPCPCPLFKEKDVCQCAGERLPVEANGPKVRLTEFVRSAGCASKISQKDLHQVLDQLPQMDDPRLIVGTATADDAGVFRLAPGLTVVQTVDVFTPGVDDPYLFGQIAACNSLSDVYAMGGTPITALSVIGFPIYSLPHKVMADIIRGGIDVLKEANAILLGGHSINDEEIKFGFAVTGVIDEDNLVTNAGARPGDVLILTKPLGTGIISLAGQIDRAAPESIEAITASMSSLNKIAAEIMVRSQANACTDVTGFGLIGHLCQMVIESHVTAEIWMDSMPLFPNVQEYADEGMFSGANERNAEYSAPHTSFDDSISDNSKAILYDAQTSGGLLMTLPEQAAEKALGEMHSQGIEHASIIGRVVEDSEGEIKVLSTSGGSKRSTGNKKKTKGTSDMTKKTKEDKEEPCAHAGGESGNALQAFKDFMGAATAPGAIDVVTKELMTVALSLAVHCVPCSKFHIKKAKEMGIGNEELEEAAALAIAFGGVRIMMLWNELKKEL